MKLHDVLRQPEPVMAPAATLPTTVALRLFVAEASQAHAVASAVEQACEALRLAYELSVIDVAAQGQLADEAHLLATPTLELRLRGGGVESERTHRFVGGLGNVGMLRRVLAETIGVA